MPPLFLCAGESVRGRVAGGNNLDFPALFLCKAYKVQFQRYAVVNCAFSAGIKIKSFIFLNAAEGGKFP